VRSANAEVDLPDRRIAVRATNERARIDLNSADASVLAALLKSLGVDENEASTLAASVTDWRAGADQSARQTSKTEHFPVATNGTGSQTGPKQKPTTRFFLHPAQLVSVPGFSKDLVKSVFPLVTVASGSKRIDPFIASAGVLNALPESTMSKVEGFIDARNGNTSPDTAILLLGVDKQLLTNEAALGWRLQISSTKRNGRSHRAEAIVAILKGGSEPYRVVYIVDDIGLLP